MTKLDGFVPRPFIVGFSSSVIVGVAMIASFLFVSGVTASAGFLLVEDFEDTVEGDLPSGWHAYVRSPSPNYPRVIPVPDGIEAPSGSQVLEVYRSPDSHVVSGSADLSFEPLNQRVVASFWIYITDNMRSMNFAMNGITSDSDETSLHTNSKSTLFLGLQKASDDVFVRLYNPAHISGTWTNGPNVALNTWYQLTFDIDVASNKFDLYVGDTIVPDIKDFPFVNATEAITGLGFHYQSVAAEKRDPAPVYIDDVIVTDCQGDYASLCTLSQVN